MILQGKQNIPKTNSKGNPRYLHGIGYDRMYWSAYTGQRDDDDDNDKDDDDTDDDDNDGDTDSH